MRSVNRLVMLRARGLSGPFFQRVGGGRRVHTAGNYLTLESVLSVFALCVDFSSCELDAVTTRRLCADFSECAIDALPSL